MCSKVKDFLTDDSFIHYIMGTAPAHMALWWDTYLKAHPEEAKGVEEAKAVLLAPPSVEVDLDDNEKEELKLRVMKSVSVFSSLSASAKRI